MRLVTMALLLAGLTLAPRSAGAQAEPAAAAEPAPDAETDASEPTPGPDAAPTDAAPTDAAPEPAPPVASAPADEFDEFEEDLDEFDDFDDVDEADRAGAFAPTEPEPPVVTLSAVAPPMAAQVWALDDELGPADDPWDDYNPAVSYTPRGEVHGGLQLRVAGLIGGAPPTLPGPLAEVSGFLDVRYGPTNPFHLRIAIAAAIQVPGDEFLGAGTTAKSSPGSFRLRIYPLAVDFGHWAAVRLGGSVGVALLEDPSRGTWGAELFAGTAAEVVLRLLDGMLELGVFAGLQLTAISSISRVEHATFVTAQGVLGATGAVVF